MKKIIENLTAACGIYEGLGINHDSQSFTGKFSITQALGGRGYVIDFSATGKDGKIYHQEQSMIAPSLNEKLVLWNLNTNTPGLVPHELRASTIKTEAIASLNFGFNTQTDMSAFREEVRLDIWNATEVSYTYSWGLPGGEFKERSSVRMTRKTIDTNRVEFLSAILLVSKEPQKLAEFYRDVIGLPLEAEKHGDTEPHYGCELGDLHFAIHPLENFKDGGYGTGSVKLAFTVFDINSFVKKVEGKGVKLAYAPKDTGFSIMTALTDPDGNYIEFTQLSDRWFSHLKNRKEKGFDVVQQWELNSKEKN